MKQALSKELLHKYKNIEMEADPSLSSGDEVDQEDTSIGEDIASFMTPQNKLEFALSGLGGFGGSSIGKLGTKLLKTKAGQKLISKFPMLSKLTKPVTQSTKNAGFNFSKSRDFSGKAKQMQTTSGVGGVDIPTGVNPKTGYKYDMDVLDTTKPIPSFSRANLEKVEIPRMKQLGQTLDANKFDVSTLTKENITFKGRSGGRTIVEVDLGNGQKQLFYKSTGSAKKVGSGVGGTTEGLWQPYAGHSNSAGSKGWFGKDGGYEDWYKSKSYRDISGNLDKLATEKGINLHLQMNDSKETFKQYRRRVGPDQADLSIIQE